MFATLDIFCLFLFICCRKTHVESGVMLIEVTDIVYMVCIDAMTYLVIDLSMFKVSNTILHIDLN